MSILEVVDASSAVLSALASVIATVLAVLAFRRQTPQQPEAGRIAEPAVSSDFWRRLISRMAPLFRAPTGGDVEVQRRWRLRAGLGLLLGGVLVAAMGVLLAVGLGLFVGPLLLAVVGWGSIATGLVRLGSIIYRSRAAGRRYRLRRTRLTLGTLLAVVVLLYAVGGTVAALVQGHNTQLPDECVAGDWEIASHIFEGTEPSTTFVGGGGSLHLGSDGTGAFTGREVEYLGTATVSGVSRSFNRRATFAFTFRYSASSGELALREVSKSGAAEQREDDGPWKKTKVDDLLPSRGYSYLPDWVAGYTCSEKSMSVSGDGVGFDLRRQ
ncbi:hypothetical protein Cs7R123_09950 [Catellatospora sp. TT07R-123]|uniref:hypothetical protein n=1 Tax=Catellatospora sp. TT07R-123 TaxID=2733863 RepID=UPI001B19BDE6|nr:hypothetical protein [Catellatospora sp. TT07R-123]GHJ43653.1 hypothetical protein Cs7R123_09950 [Catellatospora sp. TT07R-123]